ncbi:DUF1436 family protein [Salmonella enterica subsp. enterica serovar Galiema]|nr:DUF1436 family protein [Salmonella enterica subsp. enterica serovar Galiema]ECF6968481.1 DUF1436 family protein [Salmonella enterica subsp. enterica]EDV4335750.1 DUF1436 family protein [Salmonella enterica subsp. enterica]
MTFIFDVNKEYHAGANLTDKFLSLETYSGLGRYSSDPDCPCQLLSIDSDDVCISHELLQALKNSRTYTSEESEEYLSLEKTQVEYDEWVIVLMEKYNYRTRRALFKNMKYCSIICVNNIIKIQPTRHTKLEGWSWAGHDKDVIRLPVTSEPEKIGSALRQAFECCD